MRQWNCVSLCAVMGIAAWAAPAQAQPVFDLDFVALPSVVGTAGNTLEYTATGQLTTSGLAETDPGAQGWSLSMSAEGGGAIVAATTDGTAADTVPNGGFWDGGFNKTELTSGLGNEGAVSAIVLSFTLPITLPPTGQELVLKVVGNMDASGLGEPQPTTPPCLVSVSLPSDPGLIGAGQPVKTAVTVTGNTKNPGVCNAAISLAIVEEQELVRGNANNDRKIDIADSVWIINELFRGGPPTLCQDAADVNDDGQVDASDAVYNIQYLFQGGSAPPQPFPDCGIDPTEDELGCDARPLLCGG